LGVVLVAMREDANPEGADQKPAHAIEGEVR
jgi:hypothetical protein